MLSEAKELVKRMKTTPIDMRIGSVLIIRVSYNQSFTVGDMSQVSTLYLGQDLVHFKHFYLL